MKRVGIIGTGWGRMHVGAFRAAGAEVVAIAGRDARKTRRIADQEQIPLSTTEVAALVEAVEVVVVASPDALHPEHVRIALERGRAVLCEKPLARTAAEADALEALARSAGVSCAVSFPYRMLPPVAALGAWMGGRAVRELVVTLRSGFAGAEGLGEPQSPLLDDEPPMMGASGDFGGASHVIDAALWLSRARPLWVQATLRGRPVHSAALHVGCEGGGTLVITHLASPEAGIHGGWSVLGRDWEAGFSAGFVPARGGWCVSAPRALEGGRWADVAAGVEPRDGAREPWAEAHVETARAFLAALRPGAPASRLASFEDGARVQRVIAAALRSEREGRRVEVGAA